MINIDFPETDMKFFGFANLVGNTPIMCIHFNYKGEQRKLYAKAENFNLTGSIKDRMAMHILKKAYERKALVPGQVILEATSGNTGISIAAIGRALGHKVVIFMPDWMSQERKDLIRSLGADIHLVSREEGGFLGSIAKSEEMAAEIGGFLPQQFANHDNSEAHFTATGPEIWYQLMYRGIVPDAFVAGVGTGGTIMGVGAYLKSKKSDIIVRPMEPSNSPTLSTGHKVGKHRIQGISDEFIPAVLDLKCLDRVIDVDDGDAIIMAQKLSCDLGLGLGISSGANFLAALKIQNEIGADATVVTVFPDDNKKYLSTDLLRIESIKNDFLSIDVDLSYYTAFKRVCATCCSPSECLEMTNIASIDREEMHTCPLAR
ncbi:MAG: PLP-dependent cysteine synthase family protein [Desulfobulbaceae bacterium]|nr:PLP-dependent cysteine synthase family protein [Desulfobulbaceae bacterium]